ncbi:MAG: hypothetical protein JW936_10300 [Sedimentisphaerales bacterium]|nr:hypothetical protein [Sedimentisphaerales bacterium]
MKDIRALVFENLRAGRPLDENVSEENWQALLDHYSCFKDHIDAQGFIVDSQVELSDFHTPRPCLHLMASCHSRTREVWGSFWDQFAGGFSCVESVLAGKMTSHLDDNYVPTAPKPQDHRGFYIHEAGNAWPMFPIPGFQEDSYSNSLCLQGLDTQLIAAQRDGLNCELTVCVHPDLPLEVWGVRIKNNSQQPRSFCWFCDLRVNIDSYPFYYFVPRVVCEGYLEDGSLVFLNHDGNNKHPRQAFFTSAPGFIGYDMMSEVYHGLAGRSPIPQSVLEGKCHNSLGSQPYAGLVAAGQFQATLAPGESQQWTCAYGVCPDSNPQRADYIKNVQRELAAGIESVTARIQESWSRKIQSFMVQTGNDHFDRYFNIWSRYQARNQARFCRALDKVGYRDVLQDLMGICDFDTDYVRGMLLETLMYQSEDGRAIRQYDRFQPGGHDMRMYMDSPSWIPDLLLTYVKESGDFDLLDEQVPYFDMNTKSPDPDNCTSVYQHALQAVRSLARSTGYHGLCRIGYGDWNDALSGIGGEKGVSVWLSCACVYGAKLMEELASYLDREDDAQEMRDLAMTMTDRINAHAWDGNWYIYAINDNGHPIGSSKCEEGKIHLNVNTWALMTGIARAAGREQQVWDAIAQLETPLGHRLLMPAYTGKSRPEVGRIADQMPGMFENGSIYTHGESFYLYALIMAGKNDTCYQHLLRTLPSLLPQDIVSGPRQQQSNFAVGPEHPSYGNQLFSNFTGSLAWYRKVIQVILGIKPGFDSLTIEPCIPSDWEQYQAQKIWRGRKIHFHLRRSTASTTRITLNDKEISPKIPLADLAKDKTNHIKVELAAKPQPDFLTKAGSIKTIPDVASVANKANTSSVNS